MLLDRIANPPAGLLRRGSPVFTVGTPSVVGRIDGWRVYIWEARLPRRIEDLALDLTDATGRAHLAAWLCQQKLAVNKCTRDDGGIAQRLIDMALWFEPMTPSAIDLLARLALRVMGREA